MRVCTRSAIRRRPDGPMIDGVHAGHDGQQHLRGAHVAGGLVPPDVLLAGLERHAQRRAAVAILRHADDAAGENALVRVTGGEEGGVGSAVPHRHAEALAVADRDIGAPFARRGQEGQAEQVGGGSNQRARGMGPLAQRAKVADLAVGGGVLHQRADDARARTRSRPGRHDYLDSPCLGPGAAPPRSSAGGSARPPGRPDRSFTALTARLRFIASAAAVASSSSEALATSRPVRSDTIVWKLSSASSRPCAISAW